MSLIHWLFSTENPFQLWGFFPAAIWVIFLIVFAVGFGILETMGVLRVHGMVPLTWVLRCLPRVTWFAAAALSIWHFGVVTTKATAAKAAKLFSGVEQSGSSSGS